MLQKDTENSMNGASKKNSSIKYPQEKKAYIQNQVKVAEIPSTHNEKERLA